MMIKLFEDFKDIESICERYGITNYTINGDVIDVDGDVSFYDAALTELPLKFGHVSGDFNCEDNYLTTLEGCPTIVGGDFDCSENGLTSLEHSPKSVDGDFFCSSNLLESIEHCPVSVGGSFICNDNLLMSFEHYPESMDDFICKNNPIYEIYKLNPTIEFIKLLNEYDVIRGNIIIRDRLEDALGKSLPKNKKITNYILK